VNSIATASVFLLRRLWKRVQIYYKKKTNSI